MNSTGVPFSSGHDAHHFFRSSKQDVPIESLKTLRNQLSLKPGEGSLSVQDARIILAKEWLELSSGAQDVFVFLDKRPQPSVEAVCLSVLSSLLTLTSQHLVYQPFGHPIVKTLLTPRWVRKLNTYLSSGHSELCLAVLKLLNSMSSFAGGKEQKGLLESFSWDVKTSQKLLYMRRREKGHVQDVLARPDIRTLCLQFIFSFLSSSSHTKVTFMEQHCDIFLSVFKGLSSDPYSVVHYVLETLWIKVWQDQKIRRALKVGLFGEKTIQHLLKLYERSEQEGADPESIPANVVHHFLLAICTHRGIGICFADNGWYPRQEDDHETSKKGEKIYNKILANVLKMLKVGDDVRQQELALKILRTCPELVGSYLLFLALTQEPRLSSKWLASAAFLGTIVSLPVPVDSFCLRASDPSSSNAPRTYRPEPPPLSTIIENITPSTILRTYLTKSLQSTHPLMQHTAGLLLAQCLRKFQMVQDVFRVIVHALEEDEADGQWARRLNETEREVRKRVPEINVIIAFANTQQVTAEPNIKTSMLAELSQRLLWLYHRCMPSLVAEARYDLAKSLRSVLNSENDGVQTSAEIEGLNRLQQLHVLRMLTESDQFTWSAKAAPSGPANLYILLDLFLKTKHTSIRQAVTTLLTKALRDSLLFQHDPEELQIWLNALPTSTRSADVETPDGARLVDERQCAMAFLEACMHRCAKTPHRYIEDLDALASSSDEAGPASNISVLLLTVLEQLNAKMRGKTLGPSDALALTTFTRKVMVALLGKQPDLRLLHDLAANLRSAVTQNGLFAEFTTVTMALRRECDILDRCLAWCSPTSQPKVEDADTTPSPTVHEFLARAEQIQNTGGQSAVLQAYELVDWIRIVDQPLCAPDVCRIAAVIKRLHTPALTNLSLHLAPGTGLLWALPDEDLIDRVAIDWILLHTSQANLTDGRRISIIKAALQKNCMTLHHYNGISLCEILLLALDSARRHLSVHDFSVLKAFIFAERRNVSRLSCSLSLPGPLASVIGQILLITMDRTSPSDRQLVSPICAYWVSAIVDNLESASWQYLRGSTIWMKFMSHDDLIIIMDNLLRALRSREVVPDTVASSELTQFVEALLIALADCESTSLSVWLSQHMAALLSIQNLLPTIKLFDKAVFRSASTSLPLGCDGTPIVEEGGTLRDAIRVAEICWSSRLRPLSQDACLTQLLDRTDWSIDLSRAVASFIYRSSKARSSFWSWLSSGDQVEKPTLEKLIPAIHAFFDSSRDEEQLDRVEQHFPKGLFSALSRDFCNDALAEKDADVYGSCLVHMIKRFPSQCDAFLQQLTKRMSALPAHKLRPEALRLIRPLLVICGERSDSFVESVLGHALQWAIRHLSGPQESVDLCEPAFLAITDAVHVARRVAPHFAEPVIAAVICHHVCHAVSMHLAEALLAKIALKPANINRHLQSILQHPEFDRLVGSDPASGERKAVAKLLYRLFLAHPANTCQPSHVGPLVKLYTGSLSFADRLLLAIFQLSEEERRTSIIPVIAHWSQSTHPNKQTSLDSLSGLDTTRVLRTCLMFPYWRTISGSAAVTLDETTASRKEQSLLYDPVFLLLLFTHVMEEHPPHSALSWVSLFRTNIVSLAVRCLSSTERTIRKIALLQFARLYKSLQTADMQEKPHVIYLLDLIRYLLRNPPDQDDEDVSRLPFITTLFLAHAFRSIFYPANFVYPLTARFLLQRPEIDVKDVPMLYNMLYSNADDWKKGRTWIVRYLADGMLDSEDWRILKRRHTWDLLATRYQGTYDDNTLRHSILEVLANLTCQPHATNSLILRSSLVNWIEMQLLAIKCNEATAWAKIVENIVVVADSGQTRQAMGGEWQNGLLRCLDLLLADADVSSLRLISRTMLRLDGDKAGRSTAFRHLLDRALVRLQVFESSFDWQLPAGHIYCADDTQDLPPHRSIKLHQPIFERNFESWGRTVENLWSVSLKHGLSGHTSDRLSSRLLLWRAIVGERSSPVGEWARKQVVYCLALGDNMDRRI